MPLIISFIISIHGFKTLKKYERIVNQYFIEKIEIKNIKYTNRNYFKKTFSHYMFIFKYKNNLNPILTDNWCFYVDMKGCIEILDSKNKGNINIRNSYPISLVIYLKSI